MDISTQKLYEQQMAVNATSLVNAVQTDSSSVSQSDASDKTDSFESTLASVLTKPVTSEYTASGALTADSSSGSGQSISTTAADTTAATDTTDSTTGKTQSTQSDSSSSDSKGTTETTTELVRQPDGSIYLKTTTKNADGTSTVTLTKISDGGANAMENILGVNASDKLQDILNGKQNSTSAQTETGTSAANAATGA